jgi:cobalt-zinc-cadmium efflux system protein
MHSTRRRLLLTMGLNFLITVTEIIGGLLSGSLALISDALHNFSDGISVIISYLALRLKQYQHSRRHTFGLKRAEIFAAVFNSVVLIIITIFLFYKAAGRMLHPEPIAGKLMTLVASIGLVANIAGTLLLRRDARHSLNIKSAYLHLLSDVISSIAVILGGLAIIFLKIHWIDPLLTILIGFYILKETYSILTDALHVLMEGAPPTIQLEKLQQVVEDFPQVRNLHHVHLWTVGENDIHLEAHLDVEDMLVSESDRLRERIEQRLQQEFKIGHITLQFECTACKNTDLIHNSHA